MVFMVYIVSHLIIAAGFLIEESWTAENSRITPPKNLFSFKSTLLRQNML